MAEAAVTEPITIELTPDPADPAITVVVDTKGGAVEAKADPVAAKTEDPAAGLEDLKRQLAESERGRKLETERAQREGVARRDAEQAAMKNAGIADQARAMAANTQFDSIANALAASEREMENLQAQKAAALEKGEYAEVAKLDGAMAKTGAKIVQFEIAKDGLERQRAEAKAAPVDTGANQAQQNEQWLATIPPTTAHWIRQHPEFFANQAFQRRVLDAAEYAERVKDLKSTDPDYFKFIEEETGLRGREVAPPAKVEEAASAAAVVTARGSSPAPVARAAPVLAAAPTPSVPDPASPNGGGRQTVTLTAEERAMARSMFPKMKPTDPDPDLIYARNKAALLAEDRIGPRARQM